MALSKSECPVMSRYMSRYHHYLESPILWARYRFTDPYWTRYHHEFERMRTSMLVQQDLIDDMLEQIRASRASRAVQSSRISSCAAKCESITRSLREDSRSIAMIESEMEAWQRAVSEMHNTMSTMKSRTESMGSRIQSLKKDFDNTSIMLKTEFDIESLLAEMEEKRRAAEEECQRIYESLNLREEPVRLATWCPICKSNTCVYSTGVPSPPPTPPPRVPTPPPANICPICGAEDCQYGKARIPTPPPANICPICGAEDCKYETNGKTPLPLPIDGKEPLPVDDYLRPEPMPEPKMDEVMYCPEPEPVLLPEPIALVQVCEICGAENCAYGETSSTVCDVCFKENCPYFVKGSF